MKHPYYFLLGLLLFPTSSAKAVDQAEPLSCDSNNPTYYPRGDHWALENSASPRQYRIQKDGAPNLSLTAVKSSIDAAFNYWTSTRCNNDGNNNTPLNVSWTRGADYATKDRGDDDKKLQFNHVIYFITDTSSWQKATGADSLTIALATNLRFTSTGYVVSSDIEFNAANFAFRVNNSGCSASQSSPLCYDLTAIATHEVGHWLGFNHVNCVDAVMYPTATTSATMGSALPTHEATGACKVYNPKVKDDSYSAQWGDKCTDNSQCPGGTCIIEQLETTKFGWCTAKCSSDKSCPEAYFCNTSKSYDSTGTAVQYCLPGHRWSSSNNGDTTNYASDLCKSCNTGSDCASELCIINDDQTMQFCSMSCLPGSDTISCPSGYQCATLDSGAGACIPTSGVCTEPESSTTTCGLNEACWDYNGTPNDTSDDSYCGCDSGLVCFGFRNFGECVPICGDGLECPGSNYTCCYAIDDNGNCVTTGSAGAYGGCFDIRSENETCTRGDESICAEGLLCAQLQSTVADNCGLSWDDSMQTAKCYTLCQDKSQCRSDQSCNLCLQVSEGVGLCWPPDGTVTSTKRPLGALCSSDDQCASEYCTSNGGDKKACSQLCSYYSQSGCPAKDVNELGLEFTCERVGITTEGFCWPTSGPVTEGYNDEELIGCDCRQGMRDPMAWFMILCLAFLALRPKKEPLV